MKKLFAYSGVLVFGAIITATIDALIGVDFTKIGWLQIIHKVTYMAWGGILLNKWFGD